jgi:hypothetical protein
MFVLITQSPVCGAFAKSRKVTISLVMCVCLSVRMSVRAEPGSHWANFYYI